MKTPAKLAAGLLIGLVSISVALANDQHSFSNPEEILVRHLEIELTADFPRQQLIGSVSLDIEHRRRGVRELVLDTRDLQIGLVEISDGSAWQLAPYRLDKPDPLLGSALRIEVLDTTRQVRINYASRPEATGLQWLEARLRAYLVQVGRRKLIMPLYKALLADEEGRKLAAEIFAEARPGYQAVAVNSIEKLFEAQ